MPACEDLFHERNLRDRDLAKKEVIQSATCVKVSRDDLAAMEIHIILRKTAGDVGLS